MLPEKPWKNGAVSRLGLSIIVWLFLTGTALAVLQFIQGSPKGSPWLFAGVVAMSVILSGVALFLFRKLRTVSDWDHHMRIYLGGTSCLFGAFVASAAAAMLADGPTGNSTLRTVIGAMGLQVGMLLLLPGFLREHQTNLADAFGLSDNWKRSLLGGALGAFIFFPVGALLHMVSTRGMSQLGWKPKMQNSVTVLANADSLVELVSLGVITILLAPVVEEILFRGILYPWVKRLGYQRLALWGVSVLFASIHGNLPAFLPLFLLAILLTKLYENTRNLLAPITVHCLFNAANFFLFLWENRPIGPP